ncbi:MAG: hypothetical protein FJY88_09950 [Candidatus Eisenbacteria bacterium]|nr:hypothetical protein [Candidatus Eisenbacteria bacterium]
MRETQRCVDPERGELLAAYELGLLSREEETAFEEHCRVCASCREDLFEMAPYAQTMAAHRSGVAARLEAASAETPGAVSALRSLRRLLPGRSRMRPLLAALPAAAAVAVLVLLLTPARETGGWADLAVIEPVPYAQIPVRGAGTDEAARLFADGMAHYAAGRYAEGFSLLARCGDLAGDSDDPLIRDQAVFYAGLSLLLGGRADSSRVFLERSASSSTPIIADRSRWYLAQGCLMTGDPAGATRHLERLAAGSPGYAAAAAKQLASIRSRSSNGDDRESPD